MISLPPKSLSSLLFPRHHMPLFLQNPRLFSNFLCNLSGAALFLTTASAVLADNTGVPNISQAVSIASYGAQQFTDCTAAINSAISAAQSGSKAVYIPPGTYYYTSFTLNGIKLVGSGDSSILNAQNPATAKVKLMGSNAGIFNLKFYTVATGRVGGQDIIEVNAATNFYIENVTIDGSNATGVINYGSSFGRITANRVCNTRADSIHMTQNSHDIYVAGNYIRNSGDDCVAVVTYVSQNVPATHNILVENNDSAYQAGGRGYTVVGGDSITIRNNHIVRSSAAGIYLASESSYNTLGVNNVILSGNVLDQCPYLHPETGHKSILVYSGTSYMVQNIGILSNTITNAPNGPIDVRATNTANVYCNGNTYNGAPITSVPNANGNGSGVTGASVTSAILGGSTVKYPAFWETENLTVPNYFAKSGGTERILPVDANLSNADGTILDSNDVGDYVTFLVPNIGAGSYNIKVGIKGYPNRGKFQLQIGRADNFNGTFSNVGPVVDEYATTTVYSEVDLGTWAPGTTSDKWFRFNVVGKNAASTGGTYNYAISFDYIKLTAQ